MLATNRFSHQRYTTQRILNDRYIFDMSDAGTGKTLAALDAIAAYRQELDAGTALVLAPKSILEPAWAADCARFTPQLTVSVAYANNRANAFAQDADVYITNHDAVRWLADNIPTLKQRNIRALFIDESTAFKHHTSQRSKALRKLIQKLDLDIRVAMSATPNNNDILHIFHQALLVDEGERLGRNFYKFRDAVCTTRPRPGTVHLEYTPRADAADEIADILSDITVRHKLEECVDIPPNTERTLNIDLAPKVRKTYNELRDTAYACVNDDIITAFNAAVLHNKLLQVSSGAVYTDEAPVLVDTARYELTADLTLGRQCVVAFHWKHQRDELLKQFHKRDISVGVIDGEVSNKERLKLITLFNAGHLQVILAHPMSAGHGLTLTAGTATIWPSPTSDAELFTQFNRRIYRTGQNKKTETITILANDTIETATHQRCQTRCDQQQTILQLLQSHL